MMKDGPINSSVSGPLLSSNCTASFVRSVTLPRMPPGRLFQCTSTKRRNAPVHYDAAECCPSKIQNFPLILPVKLTLILSERWS